MPAPRPEIIAVAIAPRLDQLAELLEQLPKRVYGQVFVEAGRGEEIRQLLAPSRVTVTVLRRDADEEPGARAAAALEGWLGEWMPEEGAVSPAIIAIDGGSERLAALAHRLGARVGG